MTYKNLDRWYTELRDIRPYIPCVCAVNKIDAAMEVTKKAFTFPKKHDMPLYYVSAADGTNVVRMFRDAIRLANAYRSGDTADFVDQILRELEVGLASFLFEKKEHARYKFHLFVIVGSNIFRFFFYFSRYFSFVFLMNFVT